MVEMQHAQAGSCSREMSPKKEKEAYGVRPSRKCHMPEASSDHSPPLCKEQHPRMQPLGGQGLGKRESPLYPDIHHSAFPPVPVVGLPLPLTQN